ncbi:MAG: Trm112 family protein [Candidatus Eisenbacteria bacterium]|nr:Trm112 family protein [Candidatus Eisenbacteria bacterium]
MALSADLLAILVCPACKGDLVYDEAGQTLTCGACRLRFKVVDDIPVMLVDEAVKF